MEGQLSNEKRNCSKADQLQEVNTYLKQIRDTVPHFKLENFKTVKDLIFKDNFMATIDLKDAHYMVAIDNRDKKFFRFKFNDKLYEFNSLPNGLSSASYLFTKLLKPIMKLFREEGILCIIYLDDIFVLGNTRDETRKNICFIKNTLEELGFIINVQKSKLIPSQCLGFLYNSKNLTVHLPDDKKQKILIMVQKFLRKNTCTIRNYAKMIGVLIAACPAVKYGWLYTKGLEREKTIALYKSDNNYNANMRITESIKEDLIWWEQNINSSKTGWGAVSGSAATHGFWDEQERKFHINYLELKAIFYGLQCFAREENNSNIILRVDNKTAIAYINKMGGTQSKSLNLLSRQIWQWCENKNIYLHASYIPSKENSRADKESRQNSVETEYALNQDAYEKIILVLGVPDIDLFATKINAKCINYVSWHKDPGALTTDAFTINWRGYLFYAFPPFSLVGRVLNKIVRDKAKGILDDAPALETTFPGGVEIIRRSFLKRGVPEEAIPVMISSLSKSTLQQYSTSLKKWWEYCLQHNIKNIKPELCVAQTILKYLEVTAPFRKEEDYLVLTYKKPFHRASTQSISRWNLNQVILCSYVLHWQNQTMTIAVDKSTSILDKVLQALTELCSSYYSIKYCIFGDIFRNLSQQHILKKRHSKEETFRHCLEIASNGHKTPYVSALS
ncbi:hypothetical protein NQ317_001016 [Molorchus minor]|uniref:Reverse transcriptase domain-containing protein n=1 Tax=Molorchus minor TaxID=1323400 RepID=A0ABQ9IS56_9CUCU|nr:hypothetical protein NQ317_001016 [Molorchus minor]